MNIHSDSPDKGLPILGFTFNLTHTSLGGDILRLGYKGHWYDFLIDDGKITTNQLYSMMRKLAESYKRANDEKPYDFEVRSVLLSGSI